MTALPPNKCAAANRRYAIECVSHRFYNRISFGGGALLHPLHRPQGYGRRAQYCYGGRGGSFCYPEPPAWFDTGTPNAIHTKTPLPRS